VGITKIRAKIGDPQGFFFSRVRIVCCAQQAIAAFGTLGCVLLESILVAKFSG